MPVGVDITWNAISSTTIPGIVFTNPNRQLLGEFRGSLQLIPGRRGSWFFPEVRGRRTISVPGYILREGDFDARRATMETLADWLDIDIQGRLIFSDDPTVYYEAVVGDCGNTDEWRDLGTFELQWMVNPFAWDLTLTNLILSATATYNTTFDPAIKTPLYPIIEVKPTDGTLTEFGLTINGQSIHWLGGSLAMNSTLTIDSLSAVVTTGVNTDVELTGAYNPASVTMSGVTGQFPYLLPGVNTFNFTKTTGTATAITIKIIYRKAYRK